MSRTVAIIVPVYNAGSLFRELLSALANQVDAPAFEVVLADNEVLAPELDEAILRLVPERAAL